MTALWQISSPGSMALLFLIVYFSILALAIRYKTREVNGRWWFFLRAFFPNWKFFHAVGYAPRLYMRAMATDRSWGPWQLMYPRQTRRWHHLFHNPNVNLELASQNLVEHLVADLNALADGQDARPLVIYQMVENRVRVDLDRQTHDLHPHPHPNGPVVEAFEFELRMELPALAFGDSPRDTQVMLASGPLPR
jgi:hypothetical protein